MSNDSARPRVVWFATARSPYNDFLFREITKHLALTVFVRKADLGSHPWRLEQPGFECIHLRHALFTAIREARRADMVLIVGWDSPFHLLLAALLPSRTMKVFWTDTPNNWQRNAFRDWVRRRLARYMFRRMDKVWATGAPGCQSLTALGCDPDKLTDFPFYVDLDGIASSRNMAETVELRHKHGAEDRVVIAAVGRLMPSKGYSDAIKAMANVDANAVLWLVGDGEQRSELEQLARQLGVADRVRLFGWQQPEAVARFVDACDIFVHPAHDDPFPVVVLDAMARGKPVVGSRSAGSVADRVIDGTNGYVVPAGDVATLADRLNCLVRDRAGRVAFGERTLVTARQHHVSAGIAKVLSVAGATR